MISSNLEFLLIEDNKGDVRLIEEMLNEIEDFDYNIKHVELLKEGLEHANKKDYDIIFLDLSLPDSFGLNTIIKAREKIKKTPIIILTGNDDDSVAVESAAAGAQDFLVKGQFDSKILQRTIGYAIERNRMWMSLEELTRVLQTNEGRYRDLFENSPISIWEEDLSEVKKYIDELKKSGLTNLRGYFDENPSEILKILSLVKILDVNNTTLLLYEAKSKTQIIEDQKKIFTEESLKVFKNEVISLANGNSTFESETENLTINGRRIDIFMKLTISPEFKETWSRVLISIDDITEKKKVLNELRESQARLANAQRIANLWHWNWDILNNRLEWSKGLYLLFGLKQQEFGATYEAFLDTIHPQDRQTVNEAIMSALNNTKPYNIDHRIILPNGSIRYVHEVAEVVFNESGNPIAMNCTVQDITQRKEYAVKLKESMNMLKEAQRVSNLGNWEWNIEEDILYWSDEIYRIFGLKPQEFKATFEAFLDKIHPDDREFVRDSVNSAIFDKEPYDINHRVVQPNGTICYVHELGEVTYNEKNEPIRMIGIVHDITELKVSEKAVKRLEQTLYEMNALIENAPSAIFLIDQSGKILRANEEALILFRYNLEEILNLEIFDVFDRDSLNKVKRHYNTEIYDLNEPNKREFLVKTKTGKFIYVEVISTILRITDQLIIQSFISDITERKNFEENRKLLLDELMNSIEFKSKFMATMSHELRTPLNAILGFSQLLIEDVYGTINDEQKDFLRDINSAGEHLLILINGILDLSKIEAGKLELNLQNIKLKDLIGEVNATIKPLYSNKGLEYNVEGLNDNYDFICDPTRMKQILYNLLSNGIKFTKKGSLNLRIFKRKDNWEFQVNDTGIGINKKDYDVVFREFGRVENDKTQNIQGAGLGLALTRRLVNLHGGEIWFESEVGKGTTFFLIIPEIDLINK